MKYLLDTNVICESLKTTPNKSVLDKIEKCHAEIVTAAPVWHELQYGCRRLPGSRKRERIESFLNEVVRPNIAILPYDERAADWHAAELARLTAIGQTPKFVDGQIAAITIVNGLVLVTRNTSDFKRFSRLKTANWHA